MDFRGESLFECHSTAIENRTILSFRTRFVHLGACRKWQWPVNLFGTIGVAWKCRTSEKGPCLDPYISQQVTTPDRTLSSIMIVAVLAYTALSHYYDGKLEFVGSSGYITTNSGLSDTLHGTNGTIGSDS